MSTETAAVDMNDIESINLDEICETRKSEDGKDEYTYFFGDDYHIVEEIQMRDWLKKKLESGELDKEKDNIPDLPEDTDESLFTAYGYKDLMLCVSKEFVVAWKKEENEFVRPVNIPGAQDDIEKAGGLPGWYRDTKEWLTDNKLSEEMIDDILEKVSAELTAHHI